MLILLNKILFTTTKLSPKHIVVWFDCYLLCWLRRGDVWLMTCKGICERHKALRPGEDSGGRRYSAGQKRCAMCELFIKWDGLWCPCCGCRLRANPRNTVDRKRSRRKAVVYLPNPQEVGIIFWCDWPMAAKAVANMPYLNQMMAVVRC